MKYKNRVLYSTLATFMCLFLVMGGMAAPNPPTRPPSATESTSSSSQEKQAGSSTDARQDFPPPPSPPPGYPPQGHLPNPATSPDSHPAVPAPPPPGYPPQGHLPNPATSPHSHPAVPAPPPPGYPQQQQHVPQTYPPASQPQAHVHPVPHPQFNHYYEEDMGTSLVPQQGRMAQYNKFSNTKKLQISERLQGKVNEFVTINKEINFNLHAFKAHVRQLQSVIAANRWEPNHFVNLWETEMKRVNSQVVVIKNRAESAFPKKDQQKEKLEYVHQLYSKQYKGQLIAHTNSYVDANSHLLTYAHVLTSMGLSLRNLEILRYEIEILHKRYDQKYSVSRAFNKNEDKFLASVGSHILTSLDLGILKVFHPNFEYWIGMIENIQEGISGVQMRECDPIVQSVIVNANTKKGLRTAGTAAGICSALAVGFLILL